MRGVIRVRVSVFSVAGAIEMCEEAFARDMANGIIQKIRETQVLDRDSVKLTEVLFLRHVCAVSLTSDRRPHCAERDNHTKHQMNETDRVWNGQRQKAHLRNDVVQ